MALHHYLLVYDLDAGRLIEQLDLGTDGEHAAAKYSEKEAEYRDHDRLEIVLVGADSIETIKVTHGHYFDGSAGELFGRLLSPA